MEEEESGSCAKWCPFQGCLEVEVFRCSCDVAGARGGCPLRGRRRAGRFGRASAVTCFTATTSFSFIPNTPNAVFCPYGSAGAIKPW